jgi:hypothetical protein
MLATASIAEQPAHRSGRCRTPDFRRHCLRGIARHTAKRENLTAGSIPIYFQSADKLLK